MPERSLESPLLVRRFPIQFDAVKAGDVEPAIEILLERMKRCLAELGDTHGAPTYESVLVALDRMTEPLDFAMAIIRHLESVATTPEMRAAYNAVQGPVSFF